MLLICSDQDRVLVSVTPRWRVDSAKGIQVNSRTEPARDWLCDDDAFGEKACVQSYWH